MIAWFKVQMFPVYGDYSYDKINGNSAFQWESNFQKNKQECFFPNTKEKK